MPDDDTGHFAVQKQIWFDDKITLPRSIKKPTQTLSRSSSTQGHPIHPPSPTLPSQSVPRWCSATTVQKREGRTVRVQQGRQRWSRCTCCGSLDLCMSEEGKQCSEHSSAFLWPSQAQHICWLTDQVWSRTQHSHFSRNSIEKKYESYSIWAFQNSNTCHSPHTTCFTWGYKLKACVFHYPEDRKKK